MKLTGGIQEQPTLQPIFYAPLSQGDLTDHVSGNSFIGTATTITWDSTQSMYQFYKRGSGAAICSGLNLELPFTSSSYSNVQATILFDVKFTSSTVDTGNTNMVSLAKGYYSASMRFPCLCYNLFKSGSTKSTTIINLDTLYHFAVIFNNGNIQVYIDGILTDFPLDYGSGTSYWRDSFDYTQCNNSVSIAAGNWRGNNGGIYCKEISVYNRVLTLDQIKQIQGIL